MTTKEAIYLLRNTAWLAPSLEPIDEAIDMACEALSKMEQVDEPQKNILTSEQLATECEVESPCEVCDYRLSGHCNRCTHMKYDGRWRCECVYCHYEPKDEPQTERSE